MQKAKFAVLVALLLLIPQLAFAQPHSGAISGRVVWQTQGYPPLKEVQVMAFPVDGHHPVGEALTNEDGLYIIEGLRPGEYHVLATAPGLEPEWFREAAHRRDAAAVPVREGRVTDRINFTLVRSFPPPYGGIAGRVVVDDDPSRPIPRAHLIVVPVGSERPAGHSFTDQEGRYHIWYLPPGRYHVFCEAREFYPEWFDNVRRRENATPVPVDANQTTERINFALTRCEPHPGGIAGMVINAETHRGLPQALVQAIRIEGQPVIREAMTHIDGRYLIAPLPPGPYIVKALKPGFEPQVFPDTIIVRDEIVEAINFALRPVPTGAIAGTVTDAISGDYIADAHLTAIKVGTRPVPFFARTDLSGHYIFEHLPVGEYLLEAKKPGYWPYRHPDTLYVLEHQLLEIDFSMEPIDFGTISGTVVDDSTGLPIPKATVKAFNMHHPGTFFAMTNREGQYTVERVVPGWYRLTALARGYFPSRYPDSVFVEEGGLVTDINFRMVPLPPANGVITGTVIDEETNRPIPFACLTAFGPLDRYGRPTIIRHTLSDREGNFEFLRLPEVEFRIFAAAPGHYPEFYDDVLTYREATPILPDAYGIIIDLVPVDGDQPGGFRALAGRISSEGEPVEGAIVYLYDEDGVYIGAAVSQFEGEYLVTELPPGEYRVMVCGDLEETKELGPVDLFWADKLGADYDLLFASVENNEFAGLPSSTCLHRNYPNPFNASTTISYYLSAPAKVQLSVYNLMGQKVVTLVDEQQLSGHHQAIWDGKGAKGEAVASGVYFYRLTNGNFTETKRMMLMK